MVQRHSADVDFWIDTSETNFRKLIHVFQEMGYEIEDLPDSVKNQEQNISIKFSPADLNLELITHFPLHIDFDEAYGRAEIVSIEEDENLVWKVMSLDDLIASKIKSGRTKDLLDIQELKRINNKR